MNQIKEFNVGDKVWWATCESKQVAEDCPVCFRKLKIVITLGNGDQVEVPCGFCEVGYSGPQGYVMRHSFGPDVRQIVLTAKEVNENEKGREVEYRYNCYVLRNDNVFATKEEAEAKTIELMAKREEEEAERMAYGKESNAKSYAWHVGYHQREAKRARENLEHHERKVVAMQKLARPEKSKKS